MSGECRGAVAQANPNLWAADGNDIDFCQGKPNPPLALVLCSTHATGAAASPFQCARLPRPIHKPMNY
jgi:hypothetical protein